MTMKPIRSAALALAVACTLPHAAHAAQPSETRDVAGKRVEVYGTMGQPLQVRVGGQTVIPPAVFDKDSVSMAGVQGVYGGRYVVIKGDTMGEACPAMFYAIDLSGPRPTASGALGTCSDVPRVSVDGSGALKLAFPAFRKAPAETVTFANGTAR
ncbi:conserved exported protein of unknown function (plasmid) [Rhodovastum atsumiense]|uniref:Secreted protein n=1 Tax=Rhodovastum atsumiense TaxID=504468 RepID=A0A5M6IU81_9PROT|nr:hypothetical protein [Rhodovastum atsumiense]KAA5611781.1 hypothetical protein F1189_12125 [Rhodovastum atsumiense]CAH2606118.1 conserved exported protein of unknown function [Rhodovastum atsumiense]